MFMMIGSTAVSTLLVFSDKMDELRGDLKKRFVINDDGRSVREELSRLLAWWCQDLRYGFMYNFELTFGLLMTSSSNSACCSYCTLKQNVPPPSSFITDLSATIQ
jgi:hypothetical protein